MAIRRALVFGLLAPLVLGCGAGSAGKAIRPADQKATDALGEENGGGGDAAGVACVAGRAEPLIVDWKTNDQLELTVAMQKGVAVIAYDCKSIRLVKGCSAPGQYGFTPIASVLQEAVQINDADEVKASLPFSGGKLGGEISRGSSIDIGLAYVGKRATLNDVVAKSELVGSECAGATHFVRGATIGAFVMSTGTKGSIKAAAELLGASAGGASDSTKKKMNSGGEVSACKQITGTSTNAPDACSAVVRLELLPLTGGTATAAAEKKNDAPPPLANTCPTGFAPSSGRCAKVAGGTAHRCDPTNEAECKEQCAKGDIESCYNAGSITLKGARIDGPEVTEAAALWGKACDGGIADACARLSQVIWWSPLYHNSLKDLSKAAVAAKKGCELLSPWACELYAQRADELQPAERQGLHLRACSLGHAPGCVSAAKSFLGKIGGTSGIPKNNAEGIRLLTATCDTNDKPACEDLYNVYHSKGELNDDAKATALIAKVCPRGVKMWACEHPPKDSGGTASKTADAAPSAASGPISCTSSSTKWGAIAISGTADALKITTEKGAKPTAECKKTSDPKKMTCTWTEGKKTAEHPLFVSKSGELSGAYPTGTLYSCKPK